MTQKETTKIIIGKINECLFGMDVVIVQGAQNGLGSSHGKTEVTLYPLYSTKIGTAHEYNKGGKDVSLQVWGQSYQVTIFNRTDRAKSEEIAGIVSQYLNTTRVLRQMSYLGVSLKYIDGVKAINFDDDNDIHNIAFMVEFTAVYTTELILGDSTEITSINQTLIQGV